MSEVCLATQSTSTPVRVAALQCLVKITSLYYSLMTDDYMKALFTITVSAMKSDEDEVVLQGIEFWSNVCDEEMDLQAEVEEVSLRRLLRVRLPLPHVPASLIQAKEQGIEPD